MDIVMVQTRLKNISACSKTRNQVYETGFEMNRFIGDYQVTFPFSVTRYILVNGLIILI